MRHKSHSNIFISQKDIANGIDTKEMDRAIDEHYGYEAADDVEGVVIGLRRLLGVTGRLLHVIEFADDSKIKRENVWADLAAMIRQWPPER
jgi:hypothetical protein